MRKLIIFLVTIGTLLTSCTSNKILKTYHINNSEQCNEKDGYWYKNKCWANFKEMDEGEGILPSEIDSVVDAQLAELEKTFISLDNKKYHLANAIPLPDGKAYLLIAVFKKNDTLNTIVTKIPKTALLLGRKKIKSKAVLFDADILNSNSSPNITARGKVLIEILDKKIFKARISGELLSGTHKMPVEYTLTENISGIGSSKIKIKNKQAYLNGDLGTITYRQIKNLITNHPEVRTIVFENVPGSLNDAVNMHTGRLINEAGLTTKVPYCGMIASGGVDIFCAGKNRIIEKGAKLGIHSWSAGSFDADDLPKDHPAHQYQIAYFKMCLGEKGEDFYFHTLEAAKAGDIHWMSNDEISKWNVATKITNRSNPEPYNDMPDIVGYYYGNPASNTVIVNAQGGPDVNLFTDEFKDIFSNKSNVNADNLFIVNIHQYQTLHPDEFRNKDIAFDKVVEYGKISTKLFADAVNYFKAKGKKVIVVGISYGAFLVEDYLATYGNVADGYLIVVGRLNMPKEIWIPFSEGKMIEFKDGVKYTKTIKIKDITQRNMSKLAAAYGHKRYMTLLKDTKMSNVVYAYGLTDEQVGRLSDLEINFLEQKNVKLLQGKGGHTETIFQFLGKGIDILCNRLSVK